ncbi:hypothetical protein K502DRAFT_213432 [Neoconidiobolus thromboides FSU 785]|nr:hypothetical protein K502DRAFT_213432 [Neoconidiobolus thromboides FSU 785]
MNIADTMEIIGTILAVASLIINIMVAALLISLVRNSTSILGLKFIFLTLFFDIFSPIVGLVQEFTAIASFNPMTTVAGCQAFGFFHNFMPIGSSCCVAYVSLERYLKVHSIQLPRYMLTLGVTAIIGITFVLTVISASTNQFEYTPSRMICMTDPKKYLAGSFLFHFMIIVLFVNTMAILFCYFSMLNKRKSTKLALSVPLKPMGNSVVKTEMGYKMYKPIEPVSTNKREEKIILTKTIAFVLCYVFFLFPAISVMIYHSIMRNLDPNFKLDPLLSTINFASLFSFSFINPILLLFLHNRIYAKFKEVLNSFLNLFQSNSRR